MASAGFLLSVPRRTPSASALCNIPVMLETVFGDSQPVPLRPVRPFVSRSSYNFEMAAGVRCCSGSCRTREIAVQEQTGRAHGGCGQPDLAPIRSRPSL